MYSLSDKAIDNAIKAAVEEKSRYAAERIARTESARAWYQGFIADTMDNSDIVAYRWIESNRHPTEDICDFYAKKDIFGLGAGVFPKDKAPQLPAHPHCLYHYEKVYASEVKQYGAYSEYGAYTNENDPTFTKRDKHAELYYTEIVNNGKDTFVNKISQNTGLSKRFISEVYEHVFIDTHILDGGYGKLSPSYYMAVSFQRLLDGDYNEADVLLLHHEHIERALEKRYNLTNRQAHTYAESKYNYSETFKRGGSKKWYANSKRKK